MSGAAAQPSPAHPATGHPAGGILNELELLLGREREALVQLDRDAIETFAARKLELDAALSRCAAEAPLGAAERDSLERVRRAALANQLLLAHARSCVQGMLSLLSPGNVPVYSAPVYSAPAYSATGQTSTLGAPGSTTPPPMALNLRR